MAKMNKYEAQHIKRVASYQRAIEKVFEEASKEASRLGVNLNAPTDKPFSLGDYPATKRKVNALMRKMQKKILAIVESGIDAERELADKKAEAQLRSLFPSLSAEMINQQMKMLATDRAKQEFNQRKKQGLNLSDNVWKYTDQFKSEIEMALDLGISQGKDAHALSRDVKKYLQHPDMLFRRVRDKNGVLHLSKRAKDYHPGRGVYRSSAKNALRLAATETNIAYRSADHANAVASPWVVGVRVVLSNNHTCKDSKGKPRPFTDICDTLAGDYPKGFKFTGWHPNCRCHVEYILKTPAEVQEDTRRMLRGNQPTTSSVNTVNRLPDAFYDWLFDNQERAMRSTSIPYFIKDNAEYLPKGYENFYGMKPPLQKTNKSTKQTKKQFSKQAQLTPIVDKLKTIGVKTVPLIKLSDKITEEQIIKKVGGGDKTNGSCASVAFAYIGNKCGYDVGDFRGGKSMDFMSTCMNLKAIAQNVGGTIEKNVNDFTAASKLLATLEKSKEYYFVCGKHAAIVRKNDAEELQYLELQSAILNGWKKLNRDVLKKRFGAKRSHAIYRQKYEATSLLIETKLLTEDSGFIKMLEFINTKPANQLKGKSGTIK